jgi:hypothetical protein
MIAAAGRRVSLFARAVATTTVKWTRRADRVGDRGLERAYQALLPGRRQLARAWAWCWARLRPWVGRFFAALAIGERRLRQASAVGARGATALSEVIAPGRAIAAVIVAAGACLAVSQLIDYRAVEIGLPGYADLSGVARAPTVAARTAGQAHAYLLGPLGLLAAFAGLRAMRRERRRLGLTIAALGLVALAVILLVDLPAGLDAAPQSARYAGARAVLDDGFYAELAAAAGLVLAGLLYYARPCRIRTNSSGRAASAQRRRPRRRVSSRARVARSA